MIKAVLLDLDNTLIRNPDHPFALAYLRAIEEFARETWGKSGAAEALRLAMQRMDAERSFDTTNSSIKMLALAEALGQPEAAFREALTRFYTESAAALRQCIEAVPIAKTLVETLRAKDYAVVIATNPIYAAEEVRLRLEWGGLNPDFAHYAFVTHSENMHTLKPDPAYYAEILARVGVEPDEAVIVGDSLKNDIEPAKSIGMMTYTISEHTQTDRNSGTLQDFYHAVHEQEWLEKQVPVPLHPEMIEPQMRGNISALYGLLDGVPSHFWKQHPDPKEWSILQILCHLVESENIVQRPRLKRILEEENAFLAQPIPPPGPDNFPCEGNALEIAHQFTAARMETLQFLGDLPPEAWHRPARHSIFGPTNLLEMAHFTAQHDRLHLNQLCQTIGNCK